MMRKLFAAFGILISCAVNAQWDTATTNPNVKLHGISFLNSDTGMAVGSDVSGQHRGYAFATADAGDNWTLAWWNDQYQYFDVIATGDNFWFIGEDGYYWYQNLSVTFNEGNLTSYDLFCGAAVSDSVFYCGGEQGLVYRTLDRGTTWSTFSTGTTETINDIYFANAADGWIVCNDGYMAVTGDSGNTWQFVAQPMWGFVDIMSFNYQDSLGMNPYLVGSGGVANFSVNAGVNWATIASGTGGTLQQIRFGTTNAGLIAGDDGYILRTDNGGWTWFADPSSETVDLYDIAYAGDTTAFICGDSGVILRSTIDISAVQNRPTTLFSVSAYPNPSNGPLYLNMMLPAESDLTIDVMDITGNIIQTEYHENVSAGESNMNLDLGSTAAGIYFVRISNGFSAVNMRVVRQ